MGDYFGHWLRIGESADASKLPKIFWVNWFRKSPEGAFLWPGFGDNSRVLEWVLQRVDGGSEAVDTAIGRVPTPAALDTAGLDLDATTLEQLLTVDNEAWRQEIPQIEAHYAHIGEAVPAQLHDQLDALEKRLSGS
jgi:phosphoenolpyruvate carboxykinase (GTP)